MKPAKLLALIVFFIFNSLTFSQSNIQEIKSIIEGKWFKKGVTEFNCGSALDIKFGQTIHNFCVESNQIYLEVGYIYEPEDNKINIFFLKTEDLGVGGAQLPWSFFDKYFALAEIDLTNFTGDKFTLKWLGFKNKKDRNKKYDFGFDYDGVYYSSQKNNKANNSTFEVPNKIFQHILKLHEGYSWDKSVYKKCNLRLDLNNDGINEYIYWIVGSPKTRGRGNLVIYNGKSLKSICEESGLYEVTASPSIKVLKENKKGFDSFLLGDKSELKFSFDKENVFVFS